MLEYDTMTWTDACVHCVSTISSPSHSLSS